MTTAVQMKRIVRDIESLDYIDKLDIMSRVIFMLRKPDAKISHSLSELKGLGKELWVQHDVYAYINNERASWD